MDHSFDSNTGYCCDCGIHKEIFYKTNVRCADINENQGRGNRDGEACFIATAVYGNEAMPQVISLRKFRDAVLRRTWCGKAFIAFYYKLSPPVAHWLKTKPRIASVIRSILDRIVASLP